MRFERPEQAVFWSAVGLSGVLDVCWIVVPRVYFHYHPLGPWTGADYETPIWGTFLFEIALFVGLGVTQLRLAGDLENRTAKFLFL